MTQNNFFDTFFKNFDFTPLASSFPTPALDTQQILETQKKNMQSLAQIQQLTTQSFQEITHRQNEMFSQIMRSNASIAQDMMNAGKPEDKMARNTEAMQRSYAEAIESAKEIAALVQKANSEATGILTKRADDTLKTAQEQAKKSSKATKSAA